MQKAISSSDYRRLIEWLKRARQENGWSMREMGERIDEPHTFVQKIETMERRLDVYELVQYCKALDVDPQEALRILLCEEKYSRTVRSRTNGRK